MGLGELCPVSLLRPRKRETKTRRFAPRLAGKAASRSNKERRAPQLYKGILSINNHELRHLGNRITQRDGLAGRTSLILSGLGLAFPSTDGRGRSEVILLLL
jgi:hypothetical protein